jgi:hypothetical protein
MIRLLKALLRRKRRLKPQLLTKFLYIPRLGLPSTSQDMAEQNNTSQVQVSCKMFQFFQINLKAFEFYFFITLLLFLF